ncbi:hypothetical protein ACFPM0_15540 [Pseudonocardia sulfidoxydans]
MPRPQTSSDAQPATPREQRRLIAAAPIREEQLEAWPSRSS